MNHSFSSLLAIAAATFLSVLASAQSTNCALVADLNQTVDPGISTDPSPTRSRPGGITQPTYIQCGNHWFFVGNNTGGLYRTDGTAAGTTLLRLFDGQVDGGGGGITELFSLGNTLYFTATESTHGAELWTSDGTPAGTMLLKDINTGPDNSNPGDFQALGSSLLFRASTPAHGGELWISDGTTAGTTLLKDIEPGTDSGYPISLLTNAAGDRVLFQASTNATGNELWITDGTAANTMLVSDIRTGNSGSFPNNFHNIGNTGRTIFRALQDSTGSELWVTDGTGAGTMLLKDIATGTLSSNPRVDVSCLLGNEFLFSANSANGSELWKTDGIPANTVAVLDLDPNSAVGGVNRMVGSSGSLAYFVGDDGTHGSEMWRTDGTTAGTWMLVDATANGSSQPEFGMVTLGGITFFGLEVGFDSELWRTDGTTAGTFRVLDINPQSGSRPQHLTAISATEAIFEARSPTAGNELFRTNGTTLGTQLVVDLNVRANGSEPRHITNCGGEKLFFTANDSIHGDELWVRDANGQQQVIDLNPGAGSSSIGGLSCHCIAGRHLLLLTVSGEPWVSDGTLAGTMRLVASTTLDPQFVTLGDKVLFSAQDQNGAGTELYVTDGTQTGTLMIDVEPGPNGANVNHLTRFQGRVYFVADPSAGDTELWATDGTAAGTSLFHEIHSTGHSGPANLIATANALMFMADDGVHGRELWKTDGTTAGTSLVRDILAGPTGQSGFLRTIPFARIDDNIYFPVTDGASGVELWKSDGTNAGTVRVADVVAGPGSSSPESLIAADGNIYFRSGSSLWVSDGTAAGTVAVWSGQQFGRSEGVAASGGLYFPARANSTEGTELWFTNGTSAVRVCDVATGSASSDPRALTTFRGALYFAATQPAVGREIFALQDVASVDQLTASGSAPSFCELTATAPVLGGSMVLRYENGPANSLGFTVIGSPSPAYTRSEFAPGACVVVDLATSLNVVVTAGTQGSHTVSIPNDPSFTGLSLNTQVWWLGSVTVFPLQVSNGVQVTIGQ